MLYWRKKVQSRFPPLLRLTAQLTFTQAVILGAGFDVRAYGKHGRRMKFFEVLEAPH